MNLWSQIYISAPPLSSGPLGAHHSSHCLDSYHHHPCSWQLKSLIEWIQSFQTHTTTYSSSGTMICPKHQFSSVTQSCPTLCDPMNHSTPGLPVYHQLPEFTQTHVHRVSDAIGSFKRLDRQGWQVNPHRTFLWRRVPHWHEVWKHKLLNLGPGGNATYTVTLTRSYGSIPSLCS